jgi:AcrR family transcriptional regulator
VSGRRQFDVDDALDQAMRAFWDRGYAETTLDVLGTVTGLGRGSLYGAFGGKDALFRHALDRYSEVYSSRLQQALAEHAEDPVRAIEAFFEATLNRIADPRVPVGCLIAQSAALAPTLSAASSAHVQALLGAQRRRVRRALGPEDVHAPVLDELTEFVVAVNQSLAVMSRAGTPIADLRAVVRIACSAVSSVLSSSPPHTRAEVIEQ